MAVVDIRQVTEEPCIVCIGGIVGELIIIFTCMQEYIQSTPELSSFKFRPEMLEKYIREVLVPEYNAVSTKISLTQTLEQLNGGTKPSVQEAIALLIEGDNVTNFGLKFLLTQRRDLQINDEVIKAVFHGLCTVVLDEPEEVLAELRPEDAVDEDDDPADKLKEINDRITRDNEMLAAAKAKISIGVPQEGETEYDTESEVGLLKINNVHEPVFDADGIPTKIPVNENGEQVIPEFKAANLPGKIPLIPAILPASEDGSVSQIAVYHTEAIYFVRR